MLREFSMEILSLHEFHMANNTPEELKLYVSNSTFAGNYPEFCFTQSSVQNTFFGFKLTTEIS